MSQFNYNNHRLTIENIPVIKVVKKNETPFYLYSKKQILENLKNFRKTFLQSKPLVCFSVKSNSNLSIKPEEIIPSTILGKETPKG